jgi:hypothetical protein
MAATGEHTGIRIGDSATPDFIVLDTISMRVRGRFKSRIVDTANAERWGMAA